MTEDELQALSLLGQAYGAFLKLPVIHGSDLSEFTYAIHAAQNIVLAREGLRATGIYRPNAPGTIDQVKE